MKKSETALFPAIMPREMIQELKLNALKNEQSASSIIRSLVASYLTENRNQPNRRRWLVRGSGT